MIAQIRCAPFVARGDELASLLERSKEARLGRGSLVFINGEGGIGKPRLVEEVLRHGVAVAAATARGHCMRVAAGRRTSPIASTGVARGLAG